MPQHLASSPSTRLAFLRAQAVPDPERVTAVAIEHASSPEPILCVTYAGDRIHRQPLDRSKMTITTAEERV
ncbi:hypothetical protein ASA1KI_21150 [Opitutales bacterium ASA1]|uniref:hypothetical protein n=1 Tax=Congregicoccus parvus TaxID=3081749 RepID=UPI002B31FECA|nr:hypothetical protein ASA1KI_21150 [Opitutales bacterium ASA1]